jgi:hypothetical protein
VRTWLQHHVFTRTGAAGKDALQDIQWSPQLYATESFFRTVVDDVLAKKGSANLNALNDYLRPLDEAWRFDNGQILLLSGKETDAVRRNKSNIVFLCVYMYV